MGGGAVGIGGDNLPVLVGIGLTDLLNIGGASGPPDPPGSGIAELGEKRENRKGRALEGLL